MTATTTAATTTTPRPATPTHRSGHAARITTVAATGFLGLLGGLHILKPDLSPTWRMISEYEIGRHGWLMQVAFVLLAISCVAAARVVRPITPNRAGRVARIALWVTAAGLALAAFATTDPVTATRAQLTTHGTLHGLGALLGIPGFVVAVIALSRAVRHDPTYARAVQWATYLVLAAVAVFVVSMATMFHGAPSIPDTRIGIQNRVLMITQAVWLLVVANRARHAHH